jgi:ribosome recycling factor
VVKQFIKPVSSAILSSELSLNPQPDPHNPLQLNVAIPPPTKESRDRSVTYAKSEHLRSSTAIKNARGEMKKLLKRMGRKGGSLQPDDIRALTKRLDAVVQKGNQDLDDVFENTKKALEQGQ